MDYTITKLDLSNKGLTELPTDLHKYINLIELYVNNNKLTTLDNLPQKLQSLHCDYNKLTILNNLPQGLINLSCSHNQLTSLDNLLPGLLYLYCTNNHFTYDFDPTLNNIRNYNVSMYLKHLEHNNKIIKLIYSLSKY